MIRVVYKLITKRHSEALNYNECNIVGAIMPSFESVVAGFDRNKWEKYYYLDWSAPRKKKVVGLLDVMVLIILLITNRPSGMQGPLIQSSSRHSELSGPISTTI